MHFLQSICEISHGKHAGNSAPAANATIEIPPTPPHQFTQQPKRSPANATAISLPPPANVNATATAHLTTELPPLLPPLSSAYSHQCQRYRNCSLNNRTATIHAAVTPITTVTATAHRPSPACATAKAPATTETRRRYAAVSDGSARSDNPSKSPWHPSSHRQSRHL